MSDKKRTEYVREYIKETYKTMKVYIKEEDYAKINQHMKSKGYNKFSGYVKELISKDMEQGIGEGSGQNTDDEKILGGG